MRAPFAAVARLLVTAEGCQRIKRRIINVYHAGSQSCCNRTGPPQIARGNVAGQSIGGVVRDAHRLVFVLVGNDRQHRPEYLLACDGHIITDIRKHGRFDVIAFFESIRPPGSAGNEGRSFVDPFLDQSLDLVPLKLGHHRADARIFRLWIAGLGRFGTFARDLRCFGEPLLRHQHARRRVTRLPGVFETGTGAAPDCLAEVRVVENDVGRLATEFLRDAFDRCRRILRHRNAGAGRAGKGDHCDIGMTAQRLADGRPVAVNQVENAGRYAGLVQNLGEQHRVERRDLARLQHHRAAGRQRRRNFHRDLVYRPVPGRNQRAGTDRLFHDLRRTVHLREFKVFQDIDGSPDMFGATRCLRILGQLPGGAHLFHDGGRDFVVTPFEDLENSREQCYALVARRPREARCRAVCGRYGLVHVRRGAEADASADLLGSRVDYIERVRGLRIDPFAIDIKLQQLSHLVFLVIHGLERPRIIAQSGSYGAAEDRKKGLEPAW